MRHPERERATTRGRTSRRARRAIGEDAAGVRRASAGGAVAVGEPARTGARRAAPGCDENMSRSPCRGMEALSVERQGRQEHPEPDESRRNPRGPPRGPSSGIRESGLTRAGVCTALGVVEERVAGGRRRRGPVAQARFERRLGHMLTFTGPDARSALRDRTRGDRRRRPSLSTTRGCAALPPCEPTLPNVPERALSAVLLAILLDLIGFGMLLPLLPFYGQPSMPRQRRSASCSLCYSWRARLRPVSAGSPTATAAPLSSLDRAASSPYCSSGAPARRPPVVARSLPGCRIELRHRPGLRRGHHTGPRSARGRWQAARPSARLISARASAARILAFGGSASAVPWSRPASASPAVGRNLGSRSRSPRSRAVAAESCLARHLGAVCARPLRADALFFLVCSASHHGATLALYAGRLARGAQISMAFVYVGIRLFLVQAGSCAVW